MHFHMTGFALRLVLIQRQKATWKWFIAVYTRGKYFDDGKRIWKIYYLLTESEVITGKSQTEALMY